MGRSQEDNRMISHQHEPQHRTGLYHRQWRTLRSILAVGHYLNSVPSESIVDGQAKLELLNSDTLSPEVYRTTGSSYSGIKIGDTVPIQTVAANYSTKIG